MFQRRGNPGHIPPTTWNEFTEYASFTEEFVTFARSAVKAKRTIEQAAAEYKVPAKYKGYVESSLPQLVTAATILRAAYGELQK